MEKAANSVHSLLCEDLLNVIEDDEIFIAALLHTSSYFELIGRGRMILTCETNILVIAKRVYRFFKRLTVDCEIKIEKQMNQEIKNTKVTIPVNTEVEEYCRKVRYNMFEVLDLEFIRTPQKKAEYLRGVFLSCGYIENYHDRYFLEFYFRSETYTDLFYDCFREVIPDLKKREKRKKFALFTQTRTGIESFMTVVNATRSYFRLLDAMIIKEIKEGINRKANFEFANLDRVSEAYFRFAKNFQTYVVNGGSVDELPEKLRRVVLLRRAFPEMSLSQLGRRMQPEMKKSTVNYWLKKFYKLVRARYHGI